MLTNGARCFDPTYQQKYSTCNMCSCKDGGTHAMFYKMTGFNDKKNTGIFVRRTTSCSDMIVFFIVVLLATVQCSFGFNLNIDKKVEMVGPNPGSYFGFSIAMLNKDSLNNWVLVGAPNDNSVFLPNSTQPGAIYKFTFNNNVVLREEVFIDDTEGTDSAIINGIRKSFSHGHNNQWLGAAMDVHESKGIVACASRWYNQNFISEGYFFMNGLCYEIPLDFGNGNIKKIPALIDATKQTTVVDGVSEITYGMGSLGSSVLYSKTGKDLLMGTPGLQTWTGGFIDRRSSSYIYPSYSQPATKVSEMAGYAMASGDFFNYGEAYYFAVGAPRDSLTGKVSIYSGIRSNFVIENADITLDGTEREDAPTLPVNAYFGAALCAVDVNNDNHDDLLVAAPFYSDPADKGQDEGIVFVYLGRDNVKLEMQAKPLRGSGRVGGRFGTAIGSLGDLNQDGFNDVVIGAPYEAEEEEAMQGAIYVYNGCITGVWPHYSQRVPAASVSPGLMSFGISFSRPVDMNDDGVKDIGVGAYLSDKAFILYGQPVVNVEMRLKPSVTQIDPAMPRMCVTSDGVTQLPCFYIEVCFKYSRRSIARVDIDVRATLDTYMADFSRLVFKKSGTSSVSDTLNLFSDQEMCTDPLDVLIMSTLNLVTPVRISSVFSVLDIHEGSVIKPMVSRFNGNHPEKDLLMDSKVLEFKKDCPDNVCKTDLKLKVTSDYDEPSSAFYVGDRTIEFNIEITKAGDPSYSSNLFVSFNKNLQFQKVEKVYGDTEITCGFVEESTENTESDEDSLIFQQNLNIPEISDDETLIVCSFGNPLYNNTGVSFKLKMGVSEFLTSEQLKFNFNTTTLSTEQNPVDNVHSVTITVKNKVTTSFEGVAIPFYITARDAQETYTATHVYELRNQGPSVLPGASLTIQYPNVQGGGRQLFRLNKTEWNCQPPCDISCTFPDEGSMMAVVSSLDSGPTYYFQESKSEENVGESRELSDKKLIDCTKGNCPRYECKLFNIRQRESAVVRLEYIVHGSILKEVADGSSLTVRSDAYVRLVATDRLVTDSTEHFTNVLTEIVPVTPPRKPLAWWIILVSIVGGLVLIVLVVLLLWKCGFFKRTKREEMLQMQHTGELQKLDPDANGVDNL